MKASILCALAATLALAACGKSRGPAPQTPVAPRASTDLGPVVTTSTESTAAAPVKSEIPTVPLVPPTPAATIAADQSAVIAATAGETHGPPEVPTIPAGPAVTSNPAVKTVPTIAPKSGDEATILTDALIQAAGADGKCTTKFFHRYWLLRDGVDRGLANLNAALNQMQKVMDVNGLTDGASYEVTKNYATLRSTMIEFKQNFGRHFSCTDAYHGVVISGDAEYRRFAEARERVGKLTGKPKMGSEI